jgi:hypothetical protein
VEDPTMLIVSLAYALDAKAKRAITAKIFFIFIFLIYFLFVLEIKFIYETNIKEILKIYDKLRFI